MKTGFFPRLAAENVRKNARTYLPYILTCIFTIAMYYIMKSLSLNPGMEGLWGGGYLAYIMGFGSNIIAIFAVIFLFYTYSFLNKPRKKEFGLFNVLGMEKKHIAVILAWEILYVALFSLVMGIGFGIALDKVMFLLVLRLVGAEISLGFFVAPETIGRTILLFSMIFFLTLCNAVRQIHMAKPVELLQGAKAGEKEPKAKWFLALLGFVALGIGYYMAITAENPIAALLLFFVAVVLVIVGTYLLFTAGSIVLLKLLRRSKRFYYKTNHFVSVSGMIYRMKQNAVGLANICILSTMVLVMISGTMSMVIGMEDMLLTRYPADFTVYSNTEDRNIIEAARELQKEWGLSVEKEMEYSYICFSGIQKGNSFLAEEDLDSIIMDGITNLVFIPLEDYNAAMGEDRQLQGNEVLVYSGRNKIPGNSLQIFGKEYKIVGKIERAFAANGLLASQIFSTHYVVVPDLGDICTLFKEQGEDLEAVMDSAQRYYGFDVDADEAEMLEFYSVLHNRLSGFSGRVETRAGQKQDLMQLYGGFFFLGIFLGALFIMATVLIIYYKQISEGYDDRERFEIMQKVGMGADEVKKAIHSQVLMVFFLPLILAGIHLTAAFPMMSKLLMTVSMLNTGLYMLCAVGVFLVFALMYVLIYSLTAKTYYRIVSR